jgi:hypothetical protein
MPLNMFSQTYWHSYVSYDTINYKTNSVKLYNFNTSNILEVKNKIATILDTMKIDNLNAFIYVTIEAFFTDKEKDKKNIIYKRIDSISNEIHIELKKRNITYPIYYKYNFMSTYSQNSKFSSIVISVNLIRKLY